MRKVTFKIYDIEDHPNPSKCFDWIRDNWHDLNSQAVSEVFNVLSILANKIGLQYEAVISAVPDRSENIVFKGYSKVALSKVMEYMDGLTDSVWDELVLNAIKNNQPRSILDAIHKETEAIYSDEGLKDLCIANGYEFYESGEIYREKE